jgi:hypothetical protein
VYNTRVSLLVALEQQRIGIHVFHDAKLPSDPLPQGKLQRRSGPHGSRGHLADGRRALRHDFQN